MGPDQPHPGPPPLGHAPIIITAPPPEPAPGNSFIPVPATHVGFTNAITGQRHYGVVTFALTGHMGGIAQMHVVLDEVAMPDDRPAITLADVAAAVTAQQAAGQAPGTARCVRHIYIVAGFEPGRATIPGPGAGKEGSIARAVTALDDQTPPHPATTTTTPAETLHTPEEWAEQYGIEIIGAWPDRLDTRITLVEFAGKSKYAFLNTRDIARGGVSRMRADAGLE